MADNNKIIGGAYIVNDPSPGGLFNNGDGTNPQNYTASRAANLAINEAEKAQGWAIGDTDTDGDSWSETNNAKYYAEQAEQEAANVITRIEQVDSELARAEELLDRIDSDIQNFDSELMQAETFAQNATEQAQLAQDWVIGPNNLFDLEEAPGDANNSRYWAEQAKMYSGHGDSEGSLHFAEDSQGWAVGNNTEDLNNWSATNNSMYYAEQASMSETNARLSADAAQQDSEAAAMSASSASTDAGLAAGHRDAAMGWAVDTDTDGTAEYSANSAKWWAQEAAGHHGNAEVWGKVAKSWAFGDTDIGNADMPVYGNDTDNARRHAMDASDSAGEANTSAMNAATSEEMAQGYRNEAMQWATDTDISTFTEGSAKYWAQQAQSYVVDIVDPDNLNGHANFEPQIDNTTTVFGIHNDGSETLFDGIDLTFRRDFDTPGSHRVYEFGRKPDGQYRESHLFVSTNVDTDNAKDGWLLSEHHHMSHAKVADGHDGIDVEDADTFDLITIYDFDSELINNQIIDENYWATRAYVDGEYIDVLDYTLIDPDVASYSNNVDVDTDQAYIVQNNNGHTLIFVRVPYDDNKHHKFIKVIDASDTTSYSIYRVKYANEYHGGDATEFVCDAAPVFNNQATEVDENAANFIIEVNGDEAFAIGFGLDNDAQGAIEVDTDALATWVRNNDNVFIAGNANAVQIQHQFAGAAEANAVWHLSAGDGIEYAVDVAGQTVTVAVDTDEIADSEWVIEYVATHGGGGTDSTNLTVTPAQTNVVEGSGDTDITFTVNVSNGTLVAGSTSATATDQHSHGLSVTKNSDTSFTMTVDRSIAGTATIVVTGQISDGTNNHQHTNRAHVTVAAAQVDWYIGRGTSAPTVAEPAGYTNAGPKANGETITAPSGTDTLYIIAPASDTEFAFRDEFLTINTTKTANFVTDRDLYTFDEHVDADIVLTIVGG